MQRRTNASPTPPSSRRLVRRGVVKRGLVTINLVKISLSICLFAPLGCELVERGPVSYAPGFGPPSSASPNAPVTASPSVPSRTRQAETRNQELIEAALEAMRLKEAGSLDECLGRAATLSDRFENNPHAEIVETLLLTWCQNKAPAEPAQIATSPPQPRLAQQELSRADVFLEKNDIESALGSLERAFSFDPSNAPIRDRLLTATKEEGLKRYSKGELDGALVLWQRALEIAPQDAESLRYVARAKAVSRKL